MAGAATARVTLEYTTNGGGTWVQEYTSALTHLAGEQVLGRFKNESPKDRVYRWRCITSTSGTIVCNLVRQFGESLRIKNDIVFIIGDDAPASGTDGDGVDLAGGGSLYLDQSTNVWYRNDGGPAQSNWVSL